MKVIPKFQHPADALPKIINRQMDRIIERTHPDGTISYLWRDPETNEELPLTDLGNGQYSLDRGNGVTSFFNPKQAEQINNEKKKGVANDFDKVMAGTMGITMLPIAAQVAAPAVIGALTNPSTYAGLVGGYLGEKGVDQGMKLATGKTWAQNVSNWTGAPEWLSEMSNPGVWVGGAAGVKTLNAAKQRVLNAAYNNFTPLGYADTEGLPFMNHKQEIKNMVKDIFTPKKINTSTDTYPEWYKRAMAYTETHPEKSFGPLKFKDVIKFRDEAWRLATNQKPRLGLYKPNGDGTYSYNMDLVKQIRGMGKDEPMDFLVKPTSQNTGVLNDHITSNGGFMGIRLGPHQVSPKGFYRGTTYAGKPSFTIEDVWDLQPFKDVGRTFAPTITKLGTRYPKIFGHLKDMEVLKPLGGNPFTLKQTFPEGTARIHLYPNLRLPK